MARIRLEIPEPPLFETVLPLRITDLNYGGHMGNDALLSLVHEARVRFLHHFGWSEKDMAGTGLIMRDCAIVYRAEGFYGDVLQMFISAGDLTETSFDLYYRIDRQDGKRVADVKTGIVCFNYTTGKVSRMPDTVREVLEGKPV